MIYYFGNVTCPHCEKKNRVLAEQDYAEDCFLMIGDKVVEAVQPNTTDATCEYCFQVFPLFVLEKEGVFTAIANEEQAKGYKEQPETLEVAAYGTGKKEELRLEKQLNHLFTFDFEQQPFVPNQVLDLLDEKWTVEHCYKKEHSERNYEKRMEIDFYDMYYYELKSEQGEHKWLEVVDDSQNNGKLSNENPVVLEYETLYQINDNEFKSHLIFEQEVSTQYDIEAYQHLSGVQMLVIRKERDEWDDEEEETRVVVLDLLGDSVDELILDAQEWIHVTE